MNVFERPLSQRERVAEGRVRGANYANLVPLIRPCSRWEKDSPTKFLLTLLVNYGSRVLTTGEQKSCDRGWNLRGDFRDQVFGNWPGATRHGGHEPEGRGAMTNRHPGLLATLDATDLDAGCGYGMHEVLCQKSGNHSAVERLMISA